MKITQSLDALKRNAIRNITASDSLPLLHHVIALLKNGANTTDELIQVGAKADSETALEPLFSDTDLWQAFENNQFLAIEHMGNGLKFGHDFP